ncbi:DNA ligase D [Paraburkholderia tropica]|uniref:DNA ligase D n=1 Tax=Paraburkholderia tropica TaxID=92647 RepID=UPI001601754E|nr:DNA ligase D [Paraburkholderia tropica]QNB15573.1 DNA ligase D [Paraburkholderia tropica]
MKRNLSGNLRAYEAKRRFNETPEPAPTRGRARRNGSASFVIQRHDARRLHYDFRLELDGALKSWAVPKGPSLDPSVKRLAVHVEDHPLEYGAFEGTIPAGHYGAGTVEIWDHGSWQPEGGMRAAREGYAHGHLKFTLNGDKLHGGWALVRSPMGDSKQERWLLIKQRDDDAVSEDAFKVTDGRGERNGHANQREKTPAKTKARDAVKMKNTLADSGAAKKRASKAAEKPLDQTALGKLPGAVRAAIPHTFAPQLATPADTSPKGEDWLYELKFDGYRVLARVDRREKGGRAVRIFTRSGLDWSAKFPRQMEALAALDIDSAWLDGEAVVLDDQGVPDFQALQNAFEEGHEDAIVFWLFDLPWLDGFDLRKVPLETRRAQLAALLERGDQDVLRFSAAFDGDPDDLLQAACAANLEGLVAKRRESAYTSTRSASWLKLRCARRQEFVIGGYTEPAGSRAGFGALIIGVYDEAGALHYAGRVGTGFDTALLEKLARELKTRTRKTTPFAEVPAAERRTHVHWVKPELVAEVRFKTWTSAGVVRQASFVGLRRDKAAASIVREPQSQPVKVKARASSPAHAIDKEANVEDEVSGVRITHPERVIDERSGTRKIDLVRYFAWIAPHLLPGLRNRPVALVRAPKGVDGELFFQKHANKLQIPHATQHADLDPGHAPLLTLDSLEALIGAAQMDTIELHTWNALASHIEKPDRLIFDLDPDPSLDWARMREAAQLTRELLEALGLRAWCKTSGGKGLHVVVPITRHSSWDEAKDFAQAVARHMAATLPDRFSAKMGPQNRKGRIFVDYLRNGRGATAIEAYAPRARPGLGVSTPIAWDELPRVTGGDQWNVSNLRERLDALRTDPWHEYADAKQRITAAMWTLLKCE